MSNRDALLTAAKECLRTKGYARTTARDLVAVSGANLSSIGYHFGSKEALLAEAFDQVFMEWTAHLNAAALGTPAASALERMGNSWRRMLEEMPEQEPLMLAFVESIGPSVRSPELRAKLADHYARTRAEVAESVRESLGDAEGADPDVVASYLIAVHDGFMLQFLVDPSSVPSGDRLNAALGAALAAALAAAEG
ncbi:MAG: transcriptional regulator [Solirubrobacterales bacterium]|nr:transcriptional regulator [Solirubrobacterales bacterium]